MIYGILRNSYYEVMPMAAKKKQLEPEDDDIMTLREVAKYLGLHIMTVYKLTREGRVPAANIGGQWRFKRDVLDAWLETQMNQHSN